MSTDLEEDEITSVEIRRSTDSLEKPKRCPEECLIGHECPTCSNKRYTYSKLQHEEWVLARILRDSNV
jgi:hypothetical protein